MATRSLISNRDYHGLHRPLMIDAGMKILGGASQDQGHQIEVVDIGPFDEMRVGGERILLRARRPSFDRYSSDFTLRTRNSREAPDGEIRLTEFDIVMFGGASWYLYCQGTWDSNLPTEPALSKVVMMRLSVFRETVDAFAALDMNVGDYKGFPGGLAYRYSRFPPELIYYTWTSSEGRLF